MLTMETLSLIKEYCILVDIANNIATTEEIKCYYEGISFKRLLNIYSEYNGLNCYSLEEPKYYKESYSIDILSLLKILNNE